MFSFLLSAVHAFIPVALLAGLLLALWRPAQERNALRLLLVSLAAGLVAGGIIYPVAWRQETVTAARAFLFATAIGAALGNTGTLFLAGRRAGNVSRIGLGGALFFTAALAAAGSFSFLGQVYQEALSATTVLNTELILNLGGILAGALLLAFLIPLTAHLGAKSGRKIVSGLILFVSLLLVVAWSAELLLALMRQELVELTSLRLSFVAKTSQYAQAIPYVLAALLTLLAGVFFTRRPAVAPQELAEAGQAARRKARSRVMFEMRWFRSALATVAILFAVLLYHDLYASRPPVISPPHYLTPDADGLMKIKSAEVLDGKLHRYAYISDDGHVVRFFLINRSRGQAKIGVVYDACMLCGDMGYLQEKNEVVCLACNVRIFVPSIGKAGGCNPIPLAHAVDGDQIVVSAWELDKGAHYFSQVVSRKVKDPVTGKELESSKAPFRHQYQGRTYFFESEASGEKFKTAPASYVGEQESRYYRVQGYPEV